MARELAMMFSVIFDDDESQIEFYMPKTFFDVTGSNFLKHKQNIGTSEEAIVKGDTSIGGLLVARNNHATAVISIRPVAAGGNMISLAPGKGCILPLSIACTDPYAISTVADAELEYLWIDA
jgi:hypothetical protein